MVEMCVGLVFQEAPLEFISGKLQCSDGPGLHTNILCCGIHGRAVVLYTVRPTYRGNDRPVRKAWMR